jgi:hypothetical protein
MQKLYQCRVHERKVVRYVETDQALAIERRSKPLLHLPPVDLLHHDDDIGPSDQFRGQRVLCVVVRAGGVDLEIGARHKDLFGGRATEAVLAAHEQNLLHTTAPQGRLVFDRDRVSVGIVVARIIRRWTPVAQREDMRETERRGIVVEPHREPCSNENAADANTPGLTPGPFGIAIAMNDGSLIRAGSPETFPIQSISKVFALSLALKKLCDTVFERVGREPSGDPFNSVIDLERTKGIPRNPFINAGALVVVDMLVEQFGDSARDAVLDLVKGGIKDGTSKAAVMLDRKY